MNADPENRLVCSELERIWNEKMGILSKCELEFVQDFTLRENEGIIKAGIRCSGGAEELIEVRRTPQKYETWTTSLEIVEYICSESKRHTVEEIVALLNNSDKKSGKGKSFSPNIVRGIQYHFKIPSLKQYL